MFPLIPTWFFHVLANPLLIRSVRAFSCSGVIVGVQVVATDPRSAAAGLAGNPRFENVVEEQPEEKSLNGNGEIDDAIAESVSQSVC